MDKSNLTDDQRDGEIASLVEFYSATFPNQNVESIDDLVRKHPHLDPELREALEAVDLFATTSFASEPKFVTGSIVGDFRIERQIGRGGMGTVYLATQLSLARSVAIKVMNFAINNSLAREEFQEEAQLVASLHYDSIVPIYASGETDGTHQQEHDGQILGGHRDLSPSCYYFAMKWIDGSSVADLIANKSADAVSRAEKRQRTRQVAAWGAKVAEALQYAHSQGVIHGDIKPSNLIVDHEQKIWLTDFGLARREKASSECDLPVRISTEYRGTPKYMSPEQAGAIAAPVDHRTDIYSLGATLIEWLTGESLVGGRNPVESLSQIQNNSSEPPRTMLRGYSSDWIWVLEKCLARHPEERYASAADLAKDLQAISVSQPLAARQIPSLVRLFRTAIHQKKLSRAVIVSVVASLVLAILGGNVWRNYQQSRLAPTYFDSVSGETLVVTVSDSSRNRIASVIAPSNEVLLPETELRLDVGASHRLSYSQTFNPKLANPYNDKSYTVTLKPPQSNRWLVDEVLWYQNFALIRDGVQDDCCLALRLHGLVLLKTKTGEVVWEFPDSAIRWGNAVRGYPASFQPDRYVVIKDTNKNGSQEIVVPHPTRPELMCLDGANGELLWRTNLLDAAGIQVAQANSLCPIVLQYVAEGDDSSGSLSAVVTPYVHGLDPQFRWLIGVDPITGKANWSVASQQSNSRGIQVKSTASRPRYQHWGDTENRPFEFGSLTYAGVYFSTNTSRLMLKDIRLGTERPFTIDGIDRKHLHWIDGLDWHVVDRESGLLVKNWRLPDECVCAPKILRTSSGKKLVLTGHLGPMNDTDFVAWDIESQQQVWKVTEKVNHLKMLQSYLSPPSDFPIVADLDGDGSDEWIVASNSFDANGRASEDLPWGEIQVHRSEDGQALWPEPLHIPNMDSVVERGVVVSDIDRDGWKDILLGSRFRFDESKPETMCFVDLVSGKTGHRLWHNSVLGNHHLESLGFIELVDMQVIEEERLIAVVTYNGIKTRESDHSRPYSTTFLNLDQGLVESFGLGIKLNTISKDIWLEQRFPSPQGKNRTNSVPPYQLVGWKYPEYPARTIEERTLWSLNHFGVSRIADVDHDGYPEVLGRMHNKNDGESLLDGLTGQERWKRSLPMQQNNVQQNNVQQIKYWFDLKRDADSDSLNDLAFFQFVSSLQVAGPIDDHATIEMVSGATGDTIWSHAAEESGPAEFISYLERDPSLPLIIYQNKKTGTLTCVDLESRQVAWQSDDYPTIEATNNCKIWIHEDQPLGLILNSKNQSQVASIIHAGDGKLISSFPIGQKLALSWFNWIEWKGTEVMPILMISEVDVDSAKTVHEYRSDLWLLDRSASVVGHWSETSQAAPDLVKTLFQKRHYLLPKIGLAKTSEKEERLAVPTYVDGRLVLRLIDWNLETDKSLILDRDIQFPVDPSSTVLAAQAIDFDNDGVSEIVYLSDLELACMTQTGDSLWKHSLFGEATTGIILHWELEGLHYVGFQKEMAGRGSSVFMDGRTGEVTDLRERDPRARALNGDRTDHQSLVSLGNGLDQSAVTVIAKSNRFRKGTATSQSDPRYDRSLPWVVEANYLVRYNPVRVMGLTWGHVLTLVIGVFLIPIAVGWRCFRSSFTLRQLLLVAATVALALALVTREKIDASTNGASRGTFTALEAAMQLAILFLFLFLPFLEWTKGGWRRKLSLGWYILFFVLIPVLSLSWDRPTPFKTTYSADGFWHLFWLALIPTGIVLSLIHGLRIIGLGIVRVFKILTKMDSTKRASIKPI